MRLNRYISNCGICSRRKADILIKQGKVKVNGSVVVELGTDINPDTDNVEVNNRTVKEQIKRYILLNKPKLFVTSLSDKEDNKQTITTFIEDIGERVYPVGRLDYDVEGLIFLTNDGELANRIHHPSYEIKKVYLTTVKGYLKNSDTIDENEDDVEDEHEHD